MEECILLSPFSIAHMYMCLRWLLGIKSNQGFDLGEDWVSLSQQPWTAWNPSSRGEALGDSFHPCWHVHWCWFCVGASGFVISQVQHPCSTQLTLSPSRWSSLPVLTVFLPSFPQYSLSLGCRSALWVYPPSLGSPQSLVFWILTSCGFLQWLLSAVCVCGGRTFLHWKWVRSTLISGYNKVERLEWS